MQLFGHYANTTLRVVLMAVAVLPIAGIVAAAVTPRTPFVTGQDLVTNQTVPFSHEHHAGEDGIDCRYCHSSVETSPVAGIPPTEVCMTCHSQLFANAPILSPVRDSFAHDQPMTWKRVHVLPDYVYFDHSIHIAKGVGCTTCHGQVDQMPLMGQAKPMTMEWCLDCHRAPEKYLRKADEVFSGSWSPPANQKSLGRELLIHYLIDKTHLTDCSVCHR